MDKVFVTWNVLFQEPFWIGMVERVAEGKLSVCKITFGAEPKDYEMYLFLLENYNQLQFSPAVEAVKKEMHVNPKKRQREIQKSVSHNGIGTKSQQALKLQQEQMKTERAVKNRERKEAEKQYQFELKQQKKKEKHRGR